MADTQILIETDFLGNALEKLYSDHYLWLTKWLTRKMGCPYSAADVAQDTFIKLLTYQEITAIQSPRAFLTTSASRIIINSALRKKLESSYLESIAHLQSEYSDYSPEKIHETFEALMQVAALLDSLAEKPREAFLMSRVEGMTYQDIAKELGVSKSMVKQYIAKAVAHCYHLTYF